MDHIPDHITDEQVPHDPQLAEDETDCAGCGDHNPEWLTHSYCPACQQEQKDVVHERLLDSLWEIAEAQQ